MKRLKSILVHRAFVPGIIALGTLLMAGTLNNGFLLDDYLHQLLISGDESLIWPSTAPWDVFKLIPSDAGFVKKSVETGINPWWGADEYQATFFRPISSLTLYLDHLLWPHSPLLMHLHSLLWFVALCICAWALCVRILPERHLAALALAFFVLDDAHIMPATWIANRNSLLSTTAAFTVLWLHLRWQQENWRPGRVAAPVMLAVALACGEYALGICGFLLAHVLYREEGTTGQKLWRLLPYGLVVVGWRLVYNAMGYGVWGSDLYVDPLRSPWLFFEKVLQRMPVLLASGFGTGGAEVSTFLPQSAQWLLITVSLAASLIFLWVYKPVIKESPRLRFLLTGTLLCLLPSCATFVHDRLLLMAGIGIFGSIALFMKPSFNALGPKALRAHYGAIRWMFPALWLVLHGILSPAFLPLKAELPTWLNSATMATARSLPARLSNKTVVIVVAPDMFASTFLPLWRHSLGLEVPLRTVALYNGASTLTVIRESSQSLLLEVPEGMLGVWTDALVRREDDGFTVGQQIVRANTLFTVLKVNASHNPTRVRATFDKPLDDPSFTFWYWTKGAFRKFLLPRRGDSKTIQIRPLDVLF